MAPDPIPAVPEPTAGRARRSVLVCSWRDGEHPDAGGAEVYLERVVAGLADRGWDVTVATAAHAGAPADEVADGVRRVRRGGTFTVYLRIALLYVLGRLGRPDVIVDVQNGIPFWACAWSRRPVVVLHHHAHRAQWRTIFGPVLGRLGWWLESEVAPRVQRRAHWVTVSEASRSDLTAEGVPESSITVVHNGTEPPPATGSGPAPTPRLVVLGRLVPHKRVELAIDAAAELRREGREVVLDVVGDGEWRQELEAHAATAGLGDHVRFHGHVDEATKGRLLEQAWVLLLPSVKEGWGLVVVEAASLETPTVAFRSAGGVRESIRDGHTGVLVDDPAGFVAAIRRLLDDAALRTRLGAAAQQHARSYSWETTVTRFAAVLDRAVG